MVHQRRNRLKATGNDNTEFIIFGKLGFVSEREKRRDRETDRETDRQTDRETGREAERQTENFNLAEPVIYLG